MHNYTNLELRVNKRDNVYEYIYDWREVRINQDETSRYLLIHAHVLWGADIFSILMQILTNIGEKVDVSEPAHISEEDIDAVNREWLQFVSERKGKR